MIRGGADQSIIMAGLLLATATALGAFGTHALKPGVIAPLGGISLISAWMVFVVAIIMLGKR